MLLNEPNRRDINIPFRIKPNRTAPSFNNESSIVRIASSIATLFLANEDINITRKFEEREAGIFFDRNNVFEK